MLPRVAAVTMAYDEPEMLPVWARHYARQVGADQCYVVDHGSAAHPPLPPGVNTLRIPRSPHDDQRRAGFISRLLASLLTYYDWVLYTDADELAFAHPGRYPHLPAFCAACPYPAVTAIGLDVQHVPELEPQLDAVRPIGAQRRWARFTSAMCKPVLTRTPLAFAPGFHTADQPLAFSDLYLFHLHWADRSTGLRRLAKTRMMPWAADTHGAHQRIDDATWLALFDGMARLPRLHLDALDPNSDPLKPWLARTAASARPVAGQPGQLDLHVNAPELWSIPDIFRARL